LGKIFDCSVSSKARKVSQMRWMSSSRQLAVLLAEVLAQRLEPLGGVDELHLAPAVLRLAVGQHPDVGGDAGVVEHVERQGDDGLQPVVLDDPAADVALALAGVAGEQRAAVVDLGDAAAERGVVLHLESMLARKSIWPSLERVISEYSGSPACSMTKRGSLIPLAAHALQVALPALAVGRIGEHEVELARREGVVGERRVLRAADDVVRRLALALEQQVGLADGVGLGVDLLAVEVGGDLLAVLAASSCSVSSATVSMPPVPQAPS
jgi:hypothetical protein